MNSKHNVAIFSKWNVSLIPSKHPIKYTVVEIPFLQIIQLKLQESALPLPSMAQSKSTVQHLRTACIAKARNIKMRERVCIWFSCAVVRLFLLCNNFTRSSQKCTFLSFIKRVALLFSLWKLIRRKISIPSMPSNIFVFFQDMEKVNFEKLSGLKTTD